MFSLSEKTGVSTRSFPFQGVGLEGGMATLKANIALSIQRRTIGTREDVGKFLAERDEGKRRSLDSLEEIGSITKQKKILG